MSDETAKYVAPSTVSAWFGKISEVEPFELVAVEQRHGLEGMQDGSVPLRQFLFDQANFVAAEASWAWSYDGLIECLHRYDRWKREERELGTELCVRARVSYPASA